MGCTNLALSIWELQLLSYLYGQSRDENVAMAMWKGYRASEGCEEDEDEEEILSGEVGW